MYIQATILLLLYQYPPGSEKINADKAITYHTAISN